MTTGIGQFRKQPYLSVNVYPGSGTWRVAVLLREPGRPYPRLLRTIGDFGLEPEPQNLANALRAAAAELQAQADRLDP